MRALLFGEVPIRRTGWTGLGWWFDPSKLSHEQVEEFWGRRRFLGIYPAKDRVACYAALPFAGDAGAHAEERRARLREAFADHGSSRVRAILDHLGGVEKIVPTALADLDLPRWHNGRVLLIGDASVAFPPTAGVGAAMESAAVLSDELSRVDARYIPRALDLFVKRRRGRVDTIQAESRRVLKLMAVHSPPLVWARNLAMHFVNERQMFGSIARRLAEPV